MNCPHCETHIDEHEANRCLDALVEEHVFGNDIRFYAGQYWVFGGPDGVEAYGLFPISRHYSTSIADAWIVVEKLREMGAWVSLNVTGGKTWDVRGIIDERKPTEVRFIEHSESAPEAICKAALKAVGHD